MAARIHGLAAPDTVIMSEYTARLVQGYFVCEDLGIHTLKGVAEAMAVIRVVSETDAQSRLDVVRAQGMTAIVGREEETTLLDERWRQSRAGRGQVVLISGEPGIGKSRLVEAIQEQIEREGATEIRFRGSPYFQNSAFYPILDAIQRRLQWTRDTSPEFKARQLEHWLAHYTFPDSETVPLLAAFLTLPLPADYPALTLTPQQQRQRIQETILAWLLEEASHQAVLMVLEDLHWVDPTTLEFVGLLIERVPQIRVMLMLTYRPEFMPSWDMQTAVTMLPLSRLGPQQVEAIATNVTQQRRLPAEILEQIRAKTDGIPLFVEELTKMIIESGQVQAVNGHYELSGSRTDLTIPMTLQDALMARIDRLGAAKRVVQVSAVIGREFAYDLLVAISPEKPSSLEQALSQLIEAELVTPMPGTPHAQYQFKHALIQDTAYGSLLRRTRQHVHQQIAHAIEERFPETIAAQPELVAHHYTEADHRPAAIPYWQQAGQRALQQSAHLEAISHLTSGLELLATLPVTPEH